MHINQKVETLQKENSELNECFDNLNSRIQILEETVYNPTDSLVEVPLIENPEEL